MSAKSELRQRSHARQRPLNASHVDGAIRRIPRGAFLEAAGLLTPKRGTDPLPPESLVRMMLSALDLTGGERVLELGSITGYETALLCQMAGDVISLTPDAPSALARAQVLSRLGCKNVRAVVGHDKDGWPGAAP